MKMAHIEIPSQFHRNSANVLALGVENTGSTIIGCGNELLGCADLSGMDVLDVGCGVRFTQTIINRDLPIKSYTGIDIDAPLIDYLANNVHDDRFSFHYWHIYNQMYNTTGRKLTRRTRLPVPSDKKFDVIWMYSVITHNHPSDSQCLLHILRKHINDDGGLLFSAFIDNNIDTFEGRPKDKPLSYAHYNEEYLRKVIFRAGWQVESLYDKKPDSVMQNVFLCRPRKRRFWEMF